MKFEINLTTIKGGCQLGRKVVTNNSKSDLPLGDFSLFGCLSFYIFTVLKNLRAGSIGQDIIKYEFSNQEFMTSHFACNPSFELNSSIVINVFEIL